MTQLIIAFQGEIGANSQIACENVFPDCQTLACETFEDALSAVEEGRADLGMIPIENSLAGRVADIHHFLPRSNLHIIGEYFLPIHFHLMGIKGANISDINQVYSHVHALGQCRKVIQQYGLKPMIAADTAGAARQIAEWQDKSKAALAPPLAASIYNLDVLAENVEDAAHNTTRFVILSKEPQWAAAGTRDLMTTFVFRVRNIPAALYKALGGFATNNVNMTKLESYMEEGAWASTQFLADVEGHPEDTPLKNAIEELTFFSREMRILGVYPTDAFRKS